MEDCKHEHFDETCCVCWFKVANGMPVKNVPDVFKNADKEDLLKASYNIALLWVNAAKPEEKR